MKVKLQFLASTARMTEVEKNICHDAPVVGFKLGLTKIHLAALTAKLKHLQISN